MAIAAMLLSTGGMYLGSIGGPVGSVIGSVMGQAVGGWIDDEFIIPRNVPNGPRMGEAEVQRSDEGAPIHYCLGPTTKLSGTIIWMTDIEETIHKHKENKGCHPNKTAGKTYTYSSSIAIALCEGEITAVKKIWANNTLIYDADKGTTETSASLSITKEELYYYKAQDKDNDPLVHRTYAIIASPNGGPDLSQFNSGEDIVITDFANGGNNGTFRCIRSYKNTVTGASEVVVLNSGAVVEAAGANATLAQTGELYDPDVMDGIDILLGTTGQNPNSIIEAEEGAANTPGFRGIAYIVLENFQLADYGNRIPAFQFLIEESATKTVAQAVSDILERGGLTAGQYDVTGLSGNMRGYVLSGPQPMQSSLECLMVAYDIIALEANEKLTFIHRSDSASTALTSDDLAAHEMGEDLMRALSISDSMGYSLPKEVDVHFVEPASCYLPSSQREQRLDTPAEGVLRLNLPLVLTASEARTIAKRQLWSPWANRQSIELTLPPSYLEIQENDKLTVTVHGVDYEIIVRRAERGNNGMIRVEGVTEQTHVLTQTASADAPDTTCPDIFVPPSIFATVVDVASLRNEDMQRMGFYFALCMDDPTKSEWPGAVLYRSLNDSDFHEYYSVDEGATIGEVVTSKLADVQSCESWDEINTVTIKMKQGSLSSSTKDDVLNGTNWAVIGGEVIAFVTATLTADYTYQLSTLLRGRRNTEDFTGIHEVNERFILLDDADPVHFDFYNISSVGRSWYLKGVSVGESEANVDSKEFVLQGNTARTFAPCHADGIREDRGGGGDEPEDAYITWERRSRAIFSQFAGTPCPLVEPWEKYEMDVIDILTVVRTFHITINPGSGDSTQSEETIDGVKHTYQTVTEREFVYTKAQQTADGVIPGDPFTMRFYQMSDLLGRGYKLEEVI